MNEKKLLAKKITEKMSTHLLKKVRFRKDYLGKDCTIFDLASNDAYIILDGYFHWPANKDPHNWGGPFIDKEGENWVGFRLTDENYNPRHPLLSPEVIHENNKKYATYSRYSYPRSVFDRLKMDENYWTRPFSKENPQLCSFSEMSEKELNLVLKEMTPLEKVSSEIKIASIISDSGEGNPFKHPSTLNPHKLYLCGNDDISWTICGNLDYFNEENPFDPNCFLHKVQMIFVNPSWYEIKNSSSGWYFSN